jgi:hypothetical protein
MDRSGRLRGLVECDAIWGIDWEWLAMDGAMTKAPLRGKKVGKNPTDCGKTSTKRSVPIGLAVDDANRNAFKMARETIESIAVEWPDPTPDTLQGWAWIKAMTVTRYGNCWTSLASLPASVCGGRGEGTQVRGGFQGMAVGRGTHP